MPVRIFVAILAVSACLLTLNGEARADLSSGLVAYYPFNGSAADESGNGHDGFVSGATVVADRNDVPSSAYHFDGDDFISISHHDDLNFPGPVSISVWIRPEEFGGDQLVIGKSDYFTITNFLIRVRGGGDVRWEFNEYHDTAVDTLTADQWHHIVVTAVSETGAKQIYVDGTERPHSTSAPGVFGLTTQSMTIGHASYGMGAEWFVGDIDDIRFYNRVLDPSEVQELFSEGSSCEEVVLPFFEDFEAYALGSNLCGQGCWTVNPGAMWPCRTLVGVGEGLGSNVSDGLLDTGSQSIALTFHPLPALHPQAITVLSFDIYAYSNVGGASSHGSGIAFARFGNDHSGGWFVGDDGSGPKWMFDARGITNDPVSFEFVGSSGEGYDRTIHGEVVLDGPNGEVYGRIDLGSGFVESTHYSIPSARIATVLGIHIDHDYRSFSTSVGTEIDNIFVETVPAVPVIWGLGGGVGLPLHTATSP
jgi:hypothetical protein